VGSARGAAAVRTLWRRGLLVGLLPLGAACGPAPPPTFSQLDAQLLQPSCTFSSCHSPTGKRSSGGLDLKSGAYQALVGVAARNGRAAREGLLLVEPGQPTRSFLLTKLVLAADTDPATDYGKRMPEGQPAVPTDLVEGLKSWIGAGAPND
jgi:hypothetical protein